MGILTLNIKFNINSILNANELIQLYFHGVPLKRTTQTGEVLSNETIQFYIDSATKDLEGFLNLKILKENIIEDKDFNYNDWKQWGYIRTSYPINTIDRLIGKLNGMKQIEYPPEWLSTTKNSSEEIGTKQIHIIPGRNMNASASVMMFGVLPYLGILNQPYIPNYWEIHYSTGFENVPIDIINSIGKLASLNIFYIQGDLVTGTPGLNNKSISIDGLSQSFNVSAGYGERIKNLIADLKESMNKLKNKYVGFEMMSL